MVLLSSQHIFLRKWKKVSNPFCLEEAVVAGLSQTSQLSLIQSETQAITPSRIKLQSEKDCPNFHKLYKKKFVPKTAPFLKYKSHVIDLSEVGRSGLSTEQPPSSYRPVKSHSWFTHSILQFTLFKLAQGYDVLVTLWLACPKPSVKFWSRACMYYV